jgi:predicted ATP-grasp superfamily ATP-dependent carboligase
VFRRYCDYGGGSFGNWVGLPVVFTYFNLHLVETLVKTVATLIFLLLVLPLNLALTAVALLRAGLLRPFQTRPIAAHPKTILVSGGKMTKALQLARSFHRAGHRVILAESYKYQLTGHRFSWDIDQFYPIPQPNAKDYINALLAIVEQEAVDIYVPVCSPVASYYDALAKKQLSAYCEVLHLDPDEVQKLDNKYEFSALATALNLSVPDSYCITDPQQVLDFDFAQHRQTYILKSIPYDSVRRLDLTRLPLNHPSETQIFVDDLPISKHQPWIMQAFIPGQEYCTHSMVRNGELRVHCCCQSSAFQINYAMVEHPKIEAWVRKFVGDLQLTGQVSFDFIEAADGQIYAIECNPRTHSAITMFYNHPNVAKAYLEPEPLATVVKPLESSRPTYWIYHEIWRLLANLGSISRTWARIQIIINGKDAIFDWADPLPFLMVHHLQIPWLLLGNLRQRKGWIRIDFNIGKLVELAGD